MSQSLEGEVTPTRFGFAYGSARVERICDYPDGRAVVAVLAKQGNFVEVHVSSDGRTLNAYDQDGHELTADSKTRRGQ